MSAIGSVVIGTVLFTKRSMLESERDNVPQFRKRSVALSLTNAFPYYDSYSTHTLRSISPDLGEHLRVKRGESKLLLFVGIFGCCTS